jgi:hypothetical protein
MTLPPDRRPSRIFNFQTVAGLLVTAGIIWLGLSRINLPHTLAAFTVVRVGYVLAGGALVIAVIAILAVRWHVLLPRNPDVPIRGRDLYGPPPLQLESWQQQLEWFGTVCFRSDNHYCRHPSSRRRTN